MRGIVGENRQNAIRKNWLKIPLYQWPYRIIPQRAKQLQIMRFSLYFLSQEVPRVTTTAGSW
jgi:hypothetical protein